MADREDRPDGDEGEFDFDFETMLEWSGAGALELVEEAEAAEAEAPTEAVVVEEAEDATGDFEKSAETTGDATGDFEKSAAATGDATGDFEKAAPTTGDATGDFEKSAPATRDATGDFESGAPSVDDTGDFSRDDGDAATVPSDTSTARFGTGNVDHIQKHDAAPVVPAQAYLKDIIGSTVGGCRLDEELGHGAMGTVFRATHLSLDKSVAVKILNPSLFFERKHVDSFFREARAAASLEHQNILTVHNVGSERGLLFIIMQLVEGESLADRVAREVKLPPAEVARIGIEASQGLGTAHENRIIHRDIKPANLMLTFA
ncbi:MAG: serine/threonine-protein kinase, partial [Planctomycetota bacterium]